MHRETMRREEGSGGRQGPAQGRDRRWLGREKQRSLLMEVAPALAPSWLLPASSRPCPLLSGSPDGGRTQWLCLRPQGCQGYSIPEGRQGSPGPLLIHSGLLLCLLLLQDIHRSHQASCPLPVGQGTETTGQGWGDLWKAGEEGRQRRRVQKVDGGPPVREPWTASRHTRWAHAHTHVHTHVLPQSHILAQA